MYYESMSGKRQIVLFYPTDGVEQSPWIELSWIQYASFNYIKLKNTRDTSKSSQTQFCIFKAMRRHFNVNLKMNGLSNAGPQKRFIATRKV